MSKLNKPLEVDHNQDDDDGVFRKFHDSKELLANDNKLGSPKPYVTSADTDSHHFDWELEEPGFVKEKETVPGLTSSGDIVNGHFPPLPTQALTGAQTRREPPGKGGTKLSRGTLDDQRSPRQACTEETDLTSFQWRSEKDKRKTLVKAGDFPDPSQIPIGQLIYSDDKGLLDSSSEAFQISEHENVKIGEGGNSNVYVYFRRGKYYAVKKTKYRKCELNLWSQLKHPNIVPLLGVVMGENIDHQSRHCYQFMPQMKGDLSRMICRKDVFTYCAEMNLEDLKKTSIGLALHNITYIIKEVLKGLVCMEGLNVIHKDIKVSNILIKRECYCEHLLSCNCCDEQKYSVQIADFDCATALHPEVAEYIRMRLSKGDRYMEWTKRDIWDLGIILLELILGSDNMKICMKKACALIKCYDRNEVADCIKDIAALLLLNELHKQVRCHPNLEPLVEIACRCLEVDCSKRPLARELYTSLTK